MKVNYPLLIVTAVAFGSSGFFAGTVTKLHELKPVMIAHQCAYYDMDSGEFVVGQRPLVAMTLPMPKPAKGGKQ